MQYIIAAVVIAALLVVYLWIENKNMVVTNYLLEQKKVPSNFHDMRFACITDLHYNQYGKGNARLLKAINDCKPDAILIAGDLVVTAKPQKVDVAYQFLSELTKKYPVYYAPGNHELKWGQAIGCSKEFYKTFLENLKKLGVCYLDNESITIKKGSDTLIIRGLSLPLRFFAKGKQKVEINVKEMESLIGKTQGDSYEILLAHIPDYFETYVSYGADFILSGHVHGGIMKLPYFGGVISPRYELFPKYDSGIFKKGRTVMFLSRGLGTHTIPVRVFNRPELICVEIRKC